MDVFDRTWPADVVKPRGRQQNGAFEHRDKGLRNAKVRTVSWLPCGLSCKNIPLTCGFKWWTSYKVGRTEIVVWQRKVLVKVRMAA